jgi:hypothetical protein
MESWSTPSISFREAPAKSSIRRWRLDYRHPPLKVLMLGPIVITVVIPTATIMTTIIRTMLLVHERRSLMIHWSRVS